jgi:DNA-binding transcriptional LysR family regulator
MGCVQCIVHGLPISDTDGILELHHVEAFVAIVRSGGFTKASEHLHLSQPAITRRIRLLEQELGAPLFERLGRGVILTDAGRAFLPHAHALLASARDGFDTVAALRGTDHGAVTLAVVGTLASTTLTEHLRAFRETYPGVELRLQTARSAEVSELVARGDAALGLRYGTDPRPGLVSVTVHQEPLIPVCSPGHRLTHLRQVTPAALAGERWIGFPQRPDQRPDAGGEPYTAAIRQRLAAAGLGEAEVIPIDSLTAQKRMVEAGFGVALLPESSVEEEFRAGTLHPLRVPGLRVAIPVVLIHRRHAFQTGATQALTAALTAWPTVHRVTPGHSP